MKLTYHAKQRMHLRAITVAEIKQTIEHGRVIKEQADGRIVLAHNNVRIVIALNGNHVTVITVIPTKAFEKEAKHYAKKHHMSLRQAMVTLKQGA